MIRLSRTFTTLLVALCLAGCSDSGGAGDSAEDVQPVVKTADRGAVKLAVTASKGRISIAERLELRIEAEAEPGIEVEMPQFGAAVGGFQVRDFQPAVEETLPDGRTRQAQVYDLDMLVSGEYSVPAITIRYVDRRKDDAEEAASELSTEPFTITVASLLEGEFDPQQFHDVKPPATLVADRTWGWAWVTAGVLAGLAGAGLLVRYFVGRSQRPRSVSVIPPHEWALRQLRELVAAKLIEAGRVQEFYFRLSEIVRTYIELRFGLMAPERTTEEFLAELRSSDALSADRKALLEEFLEACDMVKFALYEPATEEIERAFNAARDFVQQSVPASVATSPSARASA